jgi:hypothetical protein
MPGPAGAGGRLCTLAPAPIEPVDGALEPERTTMLSDRARHQWTAFATARKADTAPFGRRDELNRFLVGVHLRGEQLTAAELSDLLDEAGVEGQDREELVSLVETGLGLLAFYERQLEVEERGYEDPEGAGFRI